MNAERNLAFAARARQRRLEMPVLFVHAAYDAVCETLRSRLAEPMPGRARPGGSRGGLRSQLSSAQEKPAAVNALLAQWLARKGKAAWKIKGRDCSTRIATEG